MGALAILAKATLQQPHPAHALCKMAPTPMKAMKKAGASKAMTKGAIAKSIAEEFELKSNVAGKLIASLADIASKGVKSNGKFTFPGFCMVKTRTKPATKAGEREVFGKLVMVKAKPARTIVKAYPVAALKKSV